MDALKQTLFPVFPKAKHNLTISNVQVGNMWLRCIIYLSRYLKETVVACFVSPANEWLNALPSQGLHAHWHWLWS